MQGSSLQSGSLSTFNNPPTHNTPPFAHWAKGLLLHLPTLAARRAEESLLLFAAPQAHWTVLTLHRASPACS